jgi:regulator of sirC expression with transglutaminase-like and TPR domain
MLEVLRAALNNDPSIPLDRAALDLACIETPGLQAAPWLAELDRMAAAVASRLGSETSGVAFIRQTNAYLFEELAFRGNESDYSDARNSCLDQVLARRLGIPITLSLVYMELARRLHRPLFGIGLPGHFIVEYDDGDFRTFIDPFHRGKLLAESDCVNLARNIAGVGASLDPALLRAVDKRYILTRMLNNLQAAYVRAQSHHKAAAVLDVLIESAPLAPDYHKARAIARMHMREFAAASADFNAYLRYAPQAPDGDEVRRQLSAIHRWLGSVN